MVKPRALALEARGVIIEWSDGHRSVYSNKALREACPCVVCSGVASRSTSGSLPLPVVPDVAEDVRAIKCRMVGLYAVAFTWSDGHDAGIYSYDYLRKLCECEACAGKKS